MDITIEECLLNAVSHVLADQAEEASYACPFLIAHGRFPRQSQPPLVPRSTTPQFDYVLYTFQRYRFVLPLHSPEMQKWEGVAFRIRAVFADTGEDVQGTLLTYPSNKKTTRRGVLAPSLSFTINREGYSNERFGFAVSSYFFSRRAFRLVIEEEGSGAGAGALVVYVASSKHGASRAVVLREDGDRDAKRPRSADSSACTSPGDSGSEFDPAESDSSGPEATPYPPTAAPRGRRVGAAPEAPGEPTGADLVEAFTRLNPFAGRGRAGSPTLAELEAQAGGAVREEDAALADAWIAEVAADIRRLAAPYRHAGEASRAAALVRVAAADGAVRALAAAGGVWHPVAAGQHIPKTLAAACEELAAALSGPSLFDTTLWTTAEGRFHARRLLEDLRLCGHAALVAAVLASWKHCLTAPAAAAPTNSPGDAQLCAEHIWRCLRVLAGPACDVSPDLLPVERSYILELAAAADSLLEPFRAADPLLDARGRLERARALALAGQGERAGEAYFDAWSRLVQTGTTPSRFEAALLVELAEHLAGLPSKADLLADLSAKLYWFGGEEAGRTEGELEDRRGSRRWPGAAREAARFFFRSAELLEGLPGPFRALAQGAYQLLHHCALRARDLPSLLRVRAGARGRRGAAEGAGPAGGGRRRGRWGRCRRSCTGLLPELDLGAAFAKYLERPTRPTPPSRPPFTLPLAGAPRGRRRPDEAAAAEVAAGALRWMLRFFPDFVFRGSPVRALLAGHLCFHIGGAYMRGGEWARAVPYFDRALRAYHRFPAYFPPHSARVVAASDTAEGCRRRVAAAWQALLAPAPEVDIKAEPDAESDGGLEAEADQLAEAPAPAPAPAPPAAVGEAAPAPSPAAEGSGESAGTPDFDFDISTPQALWSTSE
eukprot:tig00021135_g18927.t1